jgi:tRNA (adenine37-N6)-methyltransferase
MASSTTPPGGALRPGEIVVESPEPGDASLRFIGRIHTPWTSRQECPRQGRLDGPDCRVEVFEPWVSALDGLAGYKTIEVIYWMHLSRRDLVLQSPRADGETVGTFALRSPVRPNPIATSFVALVRIDGPFLFVRGLDCVDGTPLLDLKPDRCSYTSQPHPGTGNAGDMSRS